MSLLTEFRRNVYSQNGEDGVIEEICARLQITSGTFVEFGAWDGKHLSNTFKLLQEGWHGVYIEGDTKRYEDLTLNMRDYCHQVRTIKAFVEPFGPNSLDSLLSSVDIIEDFDLLSIDIDSYDWHVWEGLRAYNPKIVVIEINSSIPVGILQTHRDASKSGSSFSATTELGKSKGYTPVCHTGNIIFVRSDLVHNIMLPNEELLYPELLFDYSYMRLSFDQPLPPAFSFLSKVYARFAMLFVKSATASTRGSEK